MRAHRLVRSQLEDAAEAGIDFANALLAAKKSDVFGVPSSASSSGVSVNYATAKKAETYAGTAFTSR